jgi:hypothetical protein
MSFLMSSMRVSARDREIFQKCAVEGKSQRVVAGEYKLTQPRIAAIVKRVKRWSEQPLPRGLGESCRAERLAGLARVHRMRLGLYRDLAMEAYRKSETVHIVKQYFDADGKKIKEEHTGKSAGGNVRFLDFAKKFDERLLEFDGVAKDGSVDLKAKDRLPDVSDLTREQKIKELEDFMKVATVMLAEEKAKAAAKARGGDGETGTGGDKVTRGQGDKVLESANDTEVASSDCGVGSEDERRLDLWSDRQGEASAANAAEPVISEKSPKLLSESLSREKTANSAVKSTSPGVIATVIGVINAAASVIKTGAGAIASSTPHSELGIPHSPTPVGLEVQPTAVVGPEVQPTKAAPPIDDFFVLFRHRLARMEVDRDDPRGKPRIRCSPGIQYPLPEHETYFDR